METVLYLCGFLLFIIFIVAIVRPEKEDVSPTEEAADEIINELLQAEAPQPPPADLFVREEDLIEVKEPVKVGDLDFLPSQGLVAMDKESVQEPTQEPVQEPVQEQKPTPEVVPEVVPEVKEEVKPVAEPVTYSEHPKKKKKHYPSKPKNKKS
jgi:hypothetical protein